jgi:2-keto-4-pentenoate hydratase/2-oxohepta-3-ene-1,7-dioic acid hydratase in catechol pathway
MLELIAGGADALAAAREAAVVAECLAVLSQGLTLLPGDVIATGTPEGVGAALGKFLQAGDRIEAEVERIGALANRVVGP